MASARHIRYVDGASSEVPSDLESTLDVEDVTSFAPQATIDVYEGPNNGNTGPLDVYSAIIAQDHAQVITTSWGNCEAQDGGPEVAAIEANLFEEAAAQGQSVVAASGDDGSTDCGAPTGNQSPVATVDDPGSQPYVTSVGGTALTALGPPPTETVWNNAEGASGGGISSNWAMPAYQSDAPASLGVIKSVLLTRAVRRPNGLLPRGSRRLGRRRPEHRPRHRLGLLGWLDVRGRNEPGGTAVGGACRARRCLADMQRPSCRVPEPGVLLDRRVRRVRERPERRDERGQPPAVDCQLVALPGYGRV